MGLFLLENGRNGMPAFDAHKAWVLKAFLLTVEAGRDLRALLDTVAYTIGVGVSAAVALIIIPILFAVERTRDDIMRAFISIPVGIVAQLQLGAERQRKAIRQAIDEDMEANDDDNDDDDDGTGDWLPRPGDGGDGPYDAGLPSSGPSVSEDIDWSELYQLESIKASRKAKSSIKDARSRRLVAGATSSTASSAAAPFAGSGDEGTQQHQQQPPPPPAHLHHPQQGGVGGWLRGLLTAAHSAASSVPSPLPPQPQRPPSRLQRRYHKGIFSSIMLALYLMPLALQLAWFIGLRGARLPACAPAHRERACCVDCAARLPSLTVALTRVSDSPLASSLPPPHPPFLLSPLHPLSAVWSVHTLDHVVTFSGYAALSVTREGALRRVASSTLFYVASAGYANEMDFGHDSGVQALRELANINSLLTYSKPAVLHVGDAEASIPSIPAELAAIGVDRAMGDETSGMPGLSAAAMQRLDGWSRGNLCARLDEDNGGLLDNGEPFNSTFCEGYRAGLFLGGTRAAIETVLGASLALITRRSEAYLAPETILSGVGVRYTTHADAPIGPLPPAPMTGPVPAAVLASSSIAAQRLTNASAVWAMNYSLIDDVNGEDMLHIETAIDHASIGTRIVTGMYAEAASAAILAFSASLRVYLGATAAIFAALMVRAYVCVGLVVRDVATVQCRWR